METQLLSPSWQLSSLRPSNNKAGLSPSSLFLLAVGITLGWNLMKRRLPSPACVSLAVLPAAGPHDECFNHCTLRAPSPPTREEAKSSPNSHAPLQAICMLDRHLPPAFLTVKTAQILLSEPVEQEAGRLAAQFFLPNISYRSCPPGLV